MRQHKRNTELLRALLVDNKYQLKEQTDITGQTPITYECKAKITDDLFVLIEFTQDTKNYLKI